MNRVDVVNGVAAVVAVVGSMAAVGAGGGAAPQAKTDGASFTRYRRIASASTVADPLLRDLCPADRLIAVSALSREGPQGHRYAGLTAIPSLEALEQIIGLSPEVLVVSNVGDARRVARLREAGIEVIDLGPPTGLASLKDDIRAVGELCGRPDAAKELASTLEARLERVAPEGEAPRPRAVYVTAYGGRYYGGTQGSSYHDVLRYAGLDDAAAARFSGFPQYTVEQLLALDPDVLVTKTGMGASLCADEALSRLKACPDGVVEVEEAYLDDPGLGMLTAAERIAAALRR